MEAEMIQGMLLVICVVEIEILLKSIVQQRKKPLLSVIFIVKRRLV